MNNRKLKKLEADVEMARGMVIYEARKLTPLQIAVEILDISVSALAIERARQSKPTAPRRPKRARQGSAKAKALSKSRVTRRRTT